jgi:hypothetical protein
LYYIYGLDGYEVPKLIAELLLDLLFSLARVPPICRAMYEQNRLSYPEVVVENIDVFPDFIL